ncbi:MAG: ATP-binding cassette domain-containing protein [Anaerolineae bacterium]
MIDVERDDGRSEERGPGYQSHDAGKVSRDAAVSVSGLTKTFVTHARRPGVGGALRDLVTRERRLVPAVRDVSFEIAAGELVGYLGPNGAGKSTTIKMLTGVLVPTSGAATVAGFVPWRERVRYTRHIGVVFGQRTNLWWDLPLSESFDLLRHVYDVPRDRHAANLHRFERLLGLDEFMSTPVRQLSLGQRMRADLAASLLHDPLVVFLDEPTIGLDVLAKERIRGFVREMNSERGVTVVLTTHDLGDVEKLCRRVLMIADGRLLFDGDLDALHARFGADREIVVDMADDYPEVGVPGASVVERQGRRVTYAFDRHGMSGSDLIQELAKRYRIADLSVRESEIETTVRRVYAEMEAHGRMEVTE